MWSFAFAFGAEPDLRVLRDYTEPLPDRPALRHGSVPAELQGRLQAVFGDRYEGCEGAPFSYYTSATGAFTAKGATETASLVGCGQRVNELTAVVVERVGGAPVVAEVVGQRIDLVADLDGDGTDDLLLSGCGTGQGYLQCSASTAMALGGPVRTARLGTVEVSQGGAPDDQFAVVFSRGVGQPLVVKSYRCDTRGAKPRCTFVHDGPVEP